MLKELKELSVKDKMVLQLLYLHPESPYISFTYKQLGEKMRVSNATIYRSIKKLKDKKLIITYDSFGTFISPCRKEYLHIKKQVLRLVLW